MDLNSLNVFSTVSSVFGGPSKKSLKDWILYIDEKNYVNEHDSIFKNALFMLIEDYRENVRELIEEGEKLSDYYKKPKHKKKIKDYINSKLHCLGNISEIELTNYQKASIEYLEKNRDKNIAILLPTGYGKTIISFYEILYYLDKGNKAIFSAPTKTLVIQQYEDFIIFLTSIGRTEFIGHLENQKSKKDLKETTKVVFTTNHRAENLCIDGYLGVGDLMVIDEIHIGEGKKEENKEKLYPIYNSAKILNKQNIRIVGLTATTVNKDVLSKKLGIDEYFYAGKQEYFIPKNRHVLPLQENESFIDIRNYIEDEIKRSSTFLFRFLIARSFSKQEIEYFTQENILKNNYLDTNSDPLILGLLEKLRNQDRKIYLNKLFKISKLIELRKVLIKENYLSLLKTLSDNYIEHRDSNIYNKKESTWLFTNIANKVVSHILALNKHPKEEKMWEIIEKNKKKNKITLVYVNNKKTVEWFIWQAEKLGIKSSYLKSAKNNSEKLVNNYTLRGMNNNKFDVVFMTSVAKLGINFDVNEFIFYHRPDNEKDLLQFEGRVGRYSRDNNIYYLFIDYFECIVEHYGKRVVKEVKNTMELPDYKIKRAKKLLKEMFFEAEKIHINGLITSIYSKGGNTFDIKKSEDELTSGNIILGHKYNGDLIEKNEIIHSRFKLLQPELHYLKNTRKPYIKLLAYDAYGGTFDLSIFGFYYEKNINDFIKFLEFEKEDVYDIKGVFIKDGFIIIDISDPNQGIIKLKENEYLESDYSGYIHKEIDAFSGDVRIDNKNELPDHKFGQEDMFLEGAKDTKGKKIIVESEDKKEELQMQDEMDI